MILSYNAALQQRIEAYGRQRKRLTYYDQAAELCDIRASDARLAKYSFSAEQEVLRRLEKAFRAFFCRVRAGSKPGFPRFRAASRYHAADMRVGGGLTIRKSRRLGVVGIPGEIKCRWHRALPSRPKSAILTRAGAKWFVIFHVDVPEAQTQAGDAVGIDLGLTSLAALSTGELIPRPNWTKRAERGMRRRNRALSRAKRGSKRREKTRARLIAYSGSVARRRGAYLHAISSDLTARFNRIAVEDLNIKGLARSRLASAIHDAAWGQLVSYLRYKAARAGGVLIEVDPRGTSQTCPECGVIKPKSLGERRHRCECGADLDRDVAAARIVLLRAFGPGAGLQAPSQRYAAQLA